MSKLTKYMRLLASPSEAVRPRQVLFTLSHMRARTTLLSHILASHEEICGHNELHINYHNSLAKLRLKARLCAMDNFVQARYLHDKLLHNKLNLNLDIFTAKVKLIVVVREPIATLNSMANMHINHWGNHNYRHLEDYYCNRLQWLMQILPTMNESIFYLDSDLLVEDTEAMLARLSDYLGLTTPLASEYRVFKDTGTAGLGDPSDNIKSGKILKAKKQLSQDYDFSYSKAMDKYQAFLQQFSTKF